MQVAEQSAGDVATPASTAHRQHGAPAPRSIATRDASASIASLIDAYMAAYDGRDTTRAQRLAFWRGRIGALKLAEVDDDLIFGVMEELAGRRGTYFAGRDASGAPILKSKRKPMAPATLNRYQAAISAVFTWAQRQRITPKGWANPARGVPMRPENNKRVRYLTDDERARLLDACRKSKTPRLYAFVLVALTTGARRGSLEGLRWRDVDLDRGEALVPRTKSGAPHVLVLTPAVVAELRRFTGAPGSLVFASRRNPAEPVDFTYAWKKALKVAGIKDFRFHDNRHDAASSLAKAGATLVEIGDALAHKQLQTTLRYAHLCVDHRRKLVHRVMSGIAAEAAS